MPVQWWVMSDRRENKELKLSLKLHHLKIPTHRNRLHFPLPVADWQSAAELVCALQVFFLLRALCHTWCCCSFHIAQSTKLALLLLALRLSGGAAGCSLSLCISHRAGSCRVMSLKQRGHHSSSKLLKRRKTHFECLVLVPAGLISGHTTREL